MTKKYLLPCTCGRKLPVEPRQAGEAIQCACGATLSAPTMLEMTSLELAEPTSPAKSRQWGARHGLALVGVVTVLVAAVLAFWHFSALPPPPRPDPTAAQIRRETQQLRPVESWRFWRVMRLGGLTRSAQPADSQYRERLFQWQMGMGLIGLIGLGGVTLAIVPLVVRKRGSAM